VLVVVVVEGVVGVVGVLGMCCCVGWSCDGKLVVFSLREVLRLRRRGRECRYLLVVKWWRRRS